MPVIQTQGGFNIGRDATVVLQGPFGSVNLVNVTDFDMRQETTEVRVDRLDGNQLQAELPKGWSGSIGFDRGSADVDQFIGSLEAAYYNGVALPASQIFVTIIEVNGSSTVFNFTNCSVKLSDAGSFKGDATVKCKIDFKAFRRNVV